MELFRPGCISKTVFPLHSQTYFSRQVLLISWNVGLLFGVSHIHFLNRLCLKTQLLGPESFLCFRCVQSMESLVVIQNFSHPHINGGSGSLSCSNQNKQQIASPPSHLGQFVFLVLYIQDLKVKLVSEGKVGTSHHRVAASVAALAAPWSWESGGSQLSLIRIRPGSCGLRTECFKEALQLTGDWGDFETIQLVCPILQTV